MLIRPHDDATSDEQRWRDFVDQQGFGHFVAPGAQRSLPVIVPTQFVLDAHRMLFHLARPNPVFDALAEQPRCVMSIAGDWAFVPGSWKAMDDEDPRWGIPTTYYAAVQLSGTATVSNDPEEIAAVLRAQIAAVDTASDLVDPLEHGNKLGAIAAVMVDVEDVRAKFKYGGNVDLEHRRHVRNRLHERNAPGDLAAAHHIPTTG